MDASVGFKEKIDEAINFFANMSQEKKQEAIVYMQNLTNTLPNIAHSKDLLSNQSVSHDAADAMVPAAIDDTPPAQYTFPANTDLNYNSYTCTSLTTPPSICRETAILSIDDQTDLSETSDLLGLDYFNPMNNESAAPDQVVASNSALPDSYCQTDNQDHANKSIAFDSPIISLSQGDIDPQLNGLSMSGDSFYDLRASSESLIGPSGFISENSKYSVINIIESNTPCDTSAAQEIGPIITDGVNIEQISSLTLESSYSNLDSITPTISSQLYQAQFTSNRHELLTQSDEPLHPIQPHGSTPSSYVEHDGSRAVCQPSHIFIEKNLDDKIQGGELDSQANQELGISETVVDYETIPHLSQPPETGGPSGISNPSLQHKCDLCGKTGFSTKGNLKRHLKNHSGEKPFSCDVCFARFTEKKSLKIHVRRHTGEKPYKCELCGKLFAQTGVLQSHMALHSNERKFECHKCDKAFRQRSQLKLHLMRHDGVKRLNCSACNARFLTKGDLERHSRIHTGERPYACQICNKTFTRQQSLTEHMNRHNGRKPYECKFCDKTFSEMSACYKHTKTHTK